MSAALPNLSPRGQQANVTPSNDTEAGDTVNEDAEFGKLMNRVGREAAERDTPEQRLEDLQKRVTLVRALHQYGPIYNDEGDEIGHGCIDDHDTWPCATLIALGVNPALARQEQRRERQEDAS